MQKGDLCRAASALRTAIQLDPSLVGAHNDLGVLMETLGNPSEALRCYRMALAANPRHPEAQCNLRSLLLQLGLAHELSRAAFAA